MSMTIVAENYQMNKTASKATEETEWRSRGWTPLRYPQSAFYVNEDYFPLHRDVLLSCTRELLILDGTLNARTLKVSEKKSRFKAQNEMIEIPRFQKHIDPESWPRSAEQVDTTIEKSRKRKKTQQGFAMKKMKIEETQCFKVENYRGKDNNQHIYNLPSAEDVALAIIHRERPRAPGTSDFQSGRIQSSEKTKRRPRIVSEADLYPSKQHNEHSVLDLNYSQEISSVLDLANPHAGGTFPRLATIESMIHASIANEAILRDAALSMTEKCVSSFNDSCLRLFLGYKAPNIRRARLIQLIAGFLFDTSHALFAWEQTETEILNRDPDIKSLDSTVQKILFDDRGLRKIGGLDPSSLLPNAVSIGRLRRRKISWESFATTVQGKRMLDHHLGEKSIISVGKLRRGQRLRQRHWLSSSLFVHDNDQEAADLAGPTRARSGSLGSGTADDAGRGITNENSRLNKILSDMPGTKAISLVKKSSNASWGVCLGKEGSACVVGRAKEESVGSKGGDFLRCGDLILHGFNEVGNEAYSPLCARYGEDSKTEDDWFRSMVDLFKKSQELQLIVQRVI